MDLTFTTDDYKNNEEVVLYNQTGLECFYMRIYKNGFSLKTAIDINGTGTNHEYDSSPYTGLNVNVQLGIGYSPIKTQKLNSLNFATL